MWSLVLAFVFALQLPAASPSLSPELEQRARVLEAKVIAPCCWSQQVSVHNSPASTEMKADIRRRLEAGQTDDAILAAYVAQYGERILAEPPARGFNTLLYVVPPVLSVVGLGILFVLLRRFTRRAHALSAAPAMAGQPGTASGYDQRLDDELRDLD